MNTNSKSLILIALILTFSISLSCEVPKKIVSFAKSAIIPGWGELSQKNNSGYFFLSSEIALHITKYYFNNESDIKINESKNFAYKKAGMTSNLKSEDQLIMVGKYNSSGFESGGYNEHIVLTARQIYPNDTASQETYISQNALSEDFHWNWDSKQSRNKYLIMRKKSMELKDYAKSISGFVILNHAISAFNAARITNKKVNLGIDLNSQNKLLMSCNYNF